MAKTIYVPKSERKSLKSVLSSMKERFEIFRNPSEKNKNNLVASLNGTYLGIDHRVKEWVEAVADGDDDSKFEAMKKIFNGCSIVDLQEVDAETKQPVVVGVNPTTSEAVYSQPVPCLVLDTVSANTVLNFSEDVLRRLMAE